MHAGARRHLGFGDVAACCLGDVAATVAQSSGEGDTRTLVLAPPTRTEGDTLVDPAAVLADMVGKHSP
jgi:hypothetical protein